MPWYTIYQIQNVRVWIPLFYQELIFGTVLVKIMSQGLALSYMVCMKISLNYDQVSCTLTHVKQWLHLFIDQYNEIMS